MPLLDNKNFIPLEEIINFFEIDTIRPTPYSPEELQSFADDFNFEVEITRLTRHVYHATPEPTLEDDIYKQNPNRSRSIIEAVSNAIDAGSTAVNIAIQSGYYRVIDDGIGMDPQTFFHQCLVPKASSKDDSQQNIGRFGLGFYTALAHLNRAEDRVILETKRNGNLGYQIEFRKLEGKFYINVIPDPNLQSIGTQLHVYSADINEIEYSEALTEHLKYHTQHPIYINQERINAEASIKPVSIDQSIVSIEPDSLYKKAVITLGGITIQTKSHDQASHTLGVVWDLPKETSLSESRNHIRVDSQSTLQQIWQLIDYVYQLPSGQQSPYLNTIAPLVVQLQASNTSQRAEDNLIDYLRSVANTCIGDKKHIPDLAIYAPLKTHGIVALHPLLVHPDWREQIGFVAPEWQSSEQKLIIAPMKDKQGLIHDEETNTIYLDPSIYNKAVKADEFWRLELLTELPPGAIQGEWKKAHGATAARNEAKTIVYIKGHDKSPYHNLYQKHGTLYDLGDKFMASLGQETVSTIAEAATNMVVHSLQKVDLGFNKMGQSTFYQYFKSYRFEGHTYYIGKGLLEMALLDEHFKPLFHKKFNLLHKKFSQLMQYGLWDIDVTLTADDRFVNYDKNNQTYTIIDGLGNTVVTASKNKVSSPELQNFGSHYLVCSQRSKTAHLYNKENELVETFYSKISIISRHPLLIGNHDLEGNVHSIYHASLNKYLLSYEINVRSVRCQISNDSIFITLYRKDGRQELLISRPPDFKTLRISDSAVQFLYPRVITYIEEKERKLFLNFTDTNKAPIEVVSYNFSFEKNGIIRISTPTNSNEYLLDNTGLLIPLPKSINSEDIAQIVQSGRHIRITSKSSQTNIIINNEGQIKAEGKEIQGVTSNQGDFFLIDHKKLIDAEGQTILERPIYKIEADPDNDYLKLEFEKLPPYANEDEQSKLNYDLIDNTGGSVIGGPSHHVAFGQGYISVQHHKGEPKTIYTPVSTIPNLRYRFKDTFSQDSQNGNYYYNTLGYPLFPGEIYLKGSNWPRDLEDVPRLLFRYEEGSNENCFINPLKKSQLQSHKVIQNIARLNQHSLKVMDYGLCLRFVDLDPTVFAALYPFMASLLYVPTAEQGQDYSQFMLHIQNRPFYEQNIIVSLLDMIYQIAGSYSTINMASKIQGILDVYGITALEDFAVTLEPYLEKMEMAKDGLSEFRNLFDEMPPHVGQLAYYIFLADSDLLAEPPLQRLNVIPEQAKELSMLDLVTAYRLDDRLIKKVAHPEQFTVKLEKLIKEDTNKHLLRRKITHAIYHQADPDKALYLREFLQNALDALEEVGEKSSPNIPLTIYKDEAGSCVLSLEDKGIGMLLEQVFRYFLIPGASSKRQAELGKFIGGRGVGLFTAYHGAKQLRLKTSTGDGTTHYFELNPVYEQNPDGSSVIRDVAIRWQSQSEDFKGTLIERVSTEGDPILHAAKLHRAIKSHGRFVNANNALITVNGVAVNQAMTPLVRFTVPNLGECTLLQSQENALSAGSLFIKKMPDKMLSWMPTIARDTLTKHGIVIDFPKNTQLNRERNDFEHVEAFHQHIKPYVTQASIAAYLNLFTQNIAKLDELPYDFFNLFSEQLDKILTRNPRVYENAEAINANRPLADYSLYEKNPQLLTDLMCFLNIIPYKASEHAQEQKVSLAYLARNYKDVKLKYTAGLPAEIQRQISFDKKSKQTLDHFSQSMSGFFSHSKISKEKQEEYMNKEWHPIAYENAVNWELFMGLQQNILEQLGGENVKLGVSTAQGSALVYAYPGKNRIYSNVINVKSRVKELTKALQKENYIAFQYLVSELFRHLSHEYTHLQESSCTGTHNKAFYLRQREILLSTMEKLDTNYVRNLFDKYVKLAQQKDISNNSATGEEFIQSQLGSPKELKREL